MFVLFNPFMSEFLIWTLLSWNLGMSTVAIRCVSQNSKTDGITKTRLFKYIEYFTTKKRKIFR